MGSNNRHNVGGWFGQRQGLGRLLAKGYIPSHEGVEISAIDGDRVCDRRHLLR